jgi:hypothetical protein
MTSVPPTSSPARETGAVLHRRETRWQIYLPFLFALLLCIAIFGAIALLNDPLARARIAIMGNMVSMALLLCPLVICLLPLYFLLAAAIFGMGKLHRAVGTPLERLERATEWAVTQVNDWTAYLQQWLIRLNTSLAPLMALFSFFNSRSTQEISNGNSKTD